MFSGIGQSKHAVNPIYKYIYIEKQFLTRQLNQWIVCLSNVKLLVHGRGIYYSPPYNQHIDSSVDNSGCSCGFSLQWWQLWVKFTVVAVVGLVYSGGSCGFSLQWWHMWV